MTPESLRREIARFLDDLREAGLALFVNPVVVTRRGAVHLISWPYKSQGGNTLASSRFATQEQYVQILKHEHYSAILFDAAVLQVTYWIKGNDILSHRLSYYPCPYDVDKDLLHSSPIHDVIELYRENRDIEPKLRTPIRFDYNPENANDHHPASHAHLMTEANRCAVFGPLTLGHFVHFIFKQFYLQQWSTHQFLSKYPVGKSTTTITLFEQSNLHFSYKEYPATIGR